MHRVAPARGLLLEIASGTGEHAAYIAPKLSQDLAWLPSDKDESALAHIDAYAADADCPRILKAVLLDVCQEQWPVKAADAIFCANMIHIAPRAAAVGLFAGAARVLPKGAPLILYGPFKRNGAHTAPSNAEFDGWLKAQNEDWGVRCLDTEIAPLAASQGFALAEIVAMPANNLTAVFRR